VLLIYPVFSCIKAQKSDTVYRLPILADLNIGKHESEIVDTLHKKSRLVEDRYITTLMLKTFPKRKNVFFPIVSGSSFSVMSLD